MTKYTYCCLMLLLGAFCAAQETFDYKAAEAKIKKYIYSRPDSTKIIIRDILSRKNLHDTILGNVYNIYGIYYNHLAMEDSSLYYYNKAMAILKDYPKIKTRPLMNASVVYRNKGEYDKSFQMLEDALAINKKLGLRKNEAIVYSNMSSNYQFMLDYDKAVDYALKGIAIIEKENEKILLGPLKQKLANTYMKMENFHFAKELNLESLKLFKTYNDNANHAITLINLAECEIHLSQLDNAKRHLKQAIKEQQIINNPHHTAIAYSKLGNIARIESDVESAEKNYTTAIKILHELNSISLVLIAAEYIELLNKSGQYSKALPVIERVKGASIFGSVNDEDKARFKLAAAKAYSETNNSQKALADLEKVMALKKGLNTATNTAETQELQAQFETKIRQQKNKVLQSDHISLKKTGEAQRLKTISIVIACIGAIAVSGLLLRSHRLKSRLRAEALKAAETERSAWKQHHDHEKDITSTQQYLIGEKQRELASSALKMAGYQDSLRQIAEKCDSGAIREMKELKAELRTLLRQNEYWKQFEARFNSLHPDFAESLAVRFPALTKNDIEFCSLLKLNLSNKEIASLLQISHETAITKKYRIKKKLSLANDTEFENLLGGI